MVNFHYKKQIDVDYNNPSPVYIRTLLDLLRRCGGVIDLVSYLKIYGSYYIQIAGNKYVRIWKNNDTIFMRDCIHHFLRDEIDKKSQLYGINLELLQSVYFDFQIKENNIITNFIRKIDANNPTQQ